MKKYNVYPDQHGDWIVFENVMTGGERIDAYSSNPVHWEAVRRYQGSLTDCNAFIQLEEAGYLKRGE